MRHPVLLLLTLVLACSSGATVVTPPPAPPPPPGGTVPSVLAVQAGNGQQAEPGAVLTVKPSVSVKDAAGLGVAGVTVTFAVDSGGGLLQSTTATTATDGTASPGDWHLGTSEGRNVMSARVAALAPVKFVATAAIVPVTVPDQSVGSGGGTITVDRPGSAINGMTIAVPAAAFPVAQTIGISYASSAAFPHPTGSTVISPLITIRTSDGRVAAKPILITIPVTVPAGTVPVIILRDPGTGRHEVLPTVDYSPTSVTGMTGHLNGSRLLGGNGGIRRSGLRDPAATGTLAVVAMPPEVLDPDHDSGFRPGVDSWEFPEGPTILDNGMSNGVVATEAWYYVEQKSSNGNLWKKYQEADGVFSSNRRGMRWASLTENESFNAMYAELKSVVPTFVAAGRGTTQSVAQRISIGSFQSVRAALADAPGEPQMAVLLTDDNNRADVTVLVYRSTGQKLFAVDPTNPSQTIVLDFSSGFLAPLTLPLEPVPYTHIAAPGTSLLGSIDALDADWAAVQAGTISDGEYPSYRAMVGWGNAVGESTELIGPAYTFGATDFPTIWVDCVSCFGETRPSPFPAGTAKVAELDLWAKNGGVWAERGTSPTVLPVLPTPGTATIGVEVLTFRSGDPASYWTDWLPITLKRLEASITPASPTGVANTDIDLTLSITGSPGNLEYLWDFADGPTVVTSTLATTHKWAAAGTYATNVTGRDRTTKQPVAKASVNVVITPAAIAWKFTSMTVTFNSAQDQLSGYDSRWRVDSEIIGRIANGTTQGGIRLVDQAFTPTGFPLRTAPVGLYLIEGTSVTLATVMHGLTENIFSIATFPNAPLTIPTAPQISGWNLVQQSAPGQPFCNISEDSYVFNGTVTQGHLIGLRVPLCVQSAILPSTNGQRLMSMDVDVTFGATTATGTITVTYYFYGNGLPAQFFQRVARLTFTAVRLVQ